MTNINYENTLMYEFDGSEEFMIYCNVYKNEIGNKQVIWSKGTDYIDLFRKGFDLNEKKLYSKAIKTLEQALTFNPIGLSARFEMVESYIALKKFDKAKEYILKTKDILTSDTFIARFYRRLGYIFTEEGNYELSYACFKKSQNFENATQTEKEIDYILTKTTINQKQNINVLLQQNNIPLFNKLNKTSNDNSAENNQHNNSEKTQDTDSQVNKTEIENRENKGKGKYCRKCGTKLNLDEIFCHKCATKVVENIDVNQNAKNKKCKNCGRNLLDDSVYCQFCGSNNIAEEQKKEESTIQTPAKGYKIQFIISIIVCACLCAGLLNTSSKLISLENEVSQKDSTISSKDKEISSLKSKVTTAESDASTYKTKAGYFDTIKNNASSSSNTNFFVSNTVLKNPNKTRVVFYIGSGGRYNIHWEYDSGITITSGNTSNGLVYIDVTYSGSGIKKIVCTNSVNNQKITIYCIGS